MLCRYFLLLCRDIASVSDVPALCVRSCSHHEVRVAIKEARSIEIAAGLMNLLLWVYHRQCHVEASSHSSLLVVGE
jgi:hypothetical protein